VESDSSFSFRILVVDDEPVVRETSAKVLATKGYEVRTAEDGFAALAALRRSLPDLVISDLRMPNMSGFELLAVVRRRFPHIPLIAISGEYKATAPEGLIADAFFSKGEYKHEDLFLRIADLLAESPLKARIVKPDKAPVWVPRHAEGYVVLTCPECLRSFSLPLEDAQGQTPRKSKCLFCDAMITFAVDDEILRQTAAG
jgi:CheY-like chemotaxis protein